MIVGFFLHRKNVSFNTLTDGIKPCLFLPLSEDSIIITLMLCKYASRYQALSNYVVLEPLPTAQRGMRKALYSFRKWPVLV